jgi:DNA-binding transcriptional MerR regulator
MAEVTEAADYLSIGEVLGLLLEEFPDITISKIRFLESQGLISPERTASGYRKFYEPDVELLRVILTEQRQNYLPLRVIKDRLETGEIDPTGEHLRPPGSVPTAGPAEHTPVRTDGHAGHDRHDHDDRDDQDDHDDHTPVEVPRAAIRSHPAARGAERNGHDRREADPPRTADDAAARAETTESTHVRTGDVPSQPEPATPDESTAAPQLLPGVLLDRAELCAMVGITDAELAQLEEFGVVAAKPGGTALYGDDAVAIARPACELMRLGLDARHLRAWRTAAEREASLFEQLVTPRYRQRNPEARAEARAELKRLDALGGALRAALTRQALRHHFES